MYQARNDPSRPAADFADGEPENASDVPGALYPPPPGGPYPPAPPPGVPFSEYTPAPPGAEVSATPSSIPVAPGARRVSGMAIASVIVGIFWFYWLGSILALVLGYMAKREIDGSNGTISGRGLAIAGIVIGWIGIGIVPLLIIVTLLGALALSSAAS